MTRRPRKEPRRETSQAIFDAILDAGEEFLETGGMDALSMSALAQRAGVSVGSLYQYFPNKDAVVASIGRRFNRSLTTKLSEALEGDGSVEQRVARMVQEFCLHGSPRVRHALLQVVSREWEYVGLLEAEGRLLQILEGLMREYWHFRDEAEIGDRTRMLFFATRGAVQGILVHDPDAIPRLAVLLSDLIVQAIRAPALHHEGAGTTEASETPEQRANPRSLASD
ncbi:MAG: TetR/AcrR family transcriptional regulator [Sandaracinaceae bacterium]